MTTAEDLVRALTAAGLSVATAESLTGGMLCSELVSVPGASAVVRGGIVSYATQVKIDVLGVPADLVEAHGVVSEACARAMASGVRTRLGADVAMATTGVAGPSSQDGHPVGTVFVAVAFDSPAGEQVRVAHLALSGDRAAIRAAACEQAMQYTLRVVRDGHTRVGQPAREQTSLG